MDAKHRTQRSGPIWWITSIVSWLLLFVLSALIIATIVVPYLAGAQRYTVLTGSMSPTYKPGSLIVVKEIDASDLAIGTPITFQLESGQPTVVTHRVVAISENTRGERVFTTQGDANSIPDDKPVIPEQIRGKVWYSFPFLGYVHSWLTGEQRKIILSVVVTALAVYAVYMFISGTRESRRDRRGRTANIDDVRLGDVQVDDARISDTATASHNESTGHVTTL
ncbi:signal peptidase I [Rhodococcus sp. NPDC056743]|uniref:signal peptidase I n=1 Tax=Rhodococcus sp. NPDC056743 TaxID=3345934 RepID=UPI00366C09B9